MIGFGGGGLEWVRGERVPVSDATINAPISCWIGGIGDSKYSDDAMNGFRTWAWASAKGDVAAVGVGDGAGLEAVAMSSKGTSIDSRELSTACFPSPSFASAGRGFLPDQRRLARRVTSPMSE